MCSDSRVQIVVFRSDYELQFYDIFKRSKKEKKLLFIFRSLRADRGRHYLAYHEIAIRERTDYDFITILVLVLQICSVISQLFSINETRIKC